MIAINMQYFKISEFDKELDRLLNFVITIKWKITLNK